MGASTRPSGSFVSGPSAQFPSDESKAKAMSKKDKSKKRKADEEGAASKDEGAKQSSHVKTKGRSYAIGGSSADGLRATSISFLAAQLARAAVAAQVDEIVIYIDEPGKKQSAEKLAEALQWIETPPALRTNLHCEPSDANLLSALKSLPPLKAPHHLSQNEDQWAEYREGVVLRTDKEGPSPQSFIDCGLDKMAVVSMLLPVGARVTLSMGPSPQTEFFSSHSESLYLASVVPAIEPRTKHGLHWGFIIRLAPSLSDALKKGPYKSGYDVTLALSKDGVERHQTHDLVLPRFSHALVVLGGKKSLKEIVESDPDLKDKGAEDLFSLYLNVCPAQPQQSIIYSEDAFLMSIGYLRPAILEYGGVNVGGK